MRLLGICGSLRAQSSNLALLRAAAQLAPVDLYPSLAALPHFNPDLDEEGAQPPPAVAELRERVERAAGLVISSPEYAHGVPGALKNALDWLVSFPPFADKPVLLLNASAAGGQFAQAQLAETLRTMSARVLDASLVEPWLRRRLAAGAALSPEESYTLQAALRALLDAAQ